MELRVKDICKEKGLRFKELADKIGISDVGLRKQVQGNPSIKTLETIAEALEVPAWKLLISEKEVQQVNSNTISCPHCGKPISIRIEATNVKNNE